jgi:hypothetical protein
VTTCSYGADRREVDERELRWCRRRGGEAEVEYADVEARCFAPSWLEEARVVGDVLDHRSAAHSSSWWSELSLLYKDLFCFRSTSEGRAAGSKDPFFKYTILLILSEAQGDMTTSACPCTKGEVQRHRRATCRAWSMCGGRPRFHCRSTGAAYSATSAPTRLSTASTISSVAPIPLRGGERIRLQAVW